MNILNEVRNILERNNYKTIQRDSKKDIIYFEDSSLIGFVSVHDTVKMIIEQWEYLQDTFLKENMTTLSDGKEKAWNIYSVYLTREKMDPTHKSKVNSIEENFRGTRKIISHNLITRTDLERALWVLLPIQKVVKMQFKDSKTRLRDKIDIPKLLEDIKAEDIVTYLMEER